MNVPTLMASRRTPPLARRHLWLGVGLVPVLVFGIGPHLAVLLGIGQRRRPGQVATRAVPLFNALHEPAVPIAVLATAATGFLSPFWLVAALACAQPHRGGLGFQRRGAGCQWVPSASFAPGPSIVLVASAVPDLPPGVGACWGPVMSAAWMGDRQATRPSIGSHATHPVHHLPPPWLSTWLSEGLLGDQKRSPQDPEPMYQGMYARETW